MYHYRESGLRNVWLRNGYTVLTTPYGEAVSIDGLAGLHKAMSLRLVMKPAKLSGTEIRFLRKEMEMSQASLASLLTVSVQTLASWEKGKARIAGSSDKLLRILVKEKYSGNFLVKKLIDEINSLDIAVHESKLIFQEQNKKWKIAA